MILQISEDIIPYLLGLYLTNIILLFCFGFWILILYMRKKQKMYAAAQYILATSLFFLFLGASRVIYMWFDFILTNFDDSQYPFYAWEWKIATAILLAGLGFFTYQLEKNPLQNKTKGIMTLIVCVFTVLIIAYPVTDISSFNIIQFFVIGPVVCIIVTPFIYFYLASKAPAYKITGITIGISIILFVLGELIVANFVVTALQAVGLGRDSIYLLAQILKIVGISFVGSAFVRELKHD